MTSHVKPCRDNWAKRVSQPHWSRVGSSHTKFRRLGKSRHTVSHPTRSEFMSQALCQMWPVVNARVYHAYVQQPGGSVWLVS